MTTIGILKRSVIWPAAALVLVLLGTGLLARPSRAQTSQTVEPTIGRILIEIKDPPGQARPWSEIARSAIVLEEGQPFDAERLRQSLEALRGSGVFREINVPDPDWEAPALALRFILTPWHRIKDIRISGEFPLLEREVLNAMTYAVGGPFRISKLAEQEAGIRRLFQNQGFIDPQIRVTATPDPENGHVSVLVNIRKGPYFEIRTVQLEGNRSFSDQRVKLRLDSWQASLLPGRMSRFTQPRLEKDTKNLTRFYRRQGFADVRVQAAVDRDPDAGQVTVRFLIEEGPRYEVVFEGNQAFYDFTLKKDLTIFKEGNLGDLGLRKSTRKIRERYRADGYQQVRIQTEAQTTQIKDRPLRRVTFLIEEGPQSIVQAVTISGNRAFKDKTIKKEMATRRPGLIAEGPFVSSTFEEDKRAVAAAYLKEGYLSAQVKDTIQWDSDAHEQRRLANIQLEIMEGPQTLVSDVTIEGLSALPLAQAQKTLALKRGAPFREYMLRSDESTLATMISEHGYPHVKVAGQAQISPDQRLAGVTYTIDQGPYVQMGRVESIGNFRTRPKIIEREMQLKAGEPFSLTKMLASQRDIRNINAFDSVRFKTMGLEEQADTVNMLVEVEERKPYYFLVGVGYDTDRRFFANTKLGDHNLFGRNKDAWLGGEISQIGYRAELGLTEPRFLGTRISATTNVTAEEREDFNQNFGTRSYSASTTFDRPLFKGLNAKLTFRFDQREQFARGNDPSSLADEDTFDARSILVTTPGLVYNGTNSFVRPTKGVLAQASVDISKGIANSLDDFLKYRLEARWYTQPFERLVLALRGRYGYIDPFADTSSIPEDQLFFLGGTTDVRGYEKNRLRVDDDGEGVGGRTEILGSLEARVALWSNFEWVTFFDVGSVQAALVDQGTNAYRSSVGVGLRYVTPIGPLGVVYGWKLDRKDGESPGELHFSVGYTF